MLLLLLDQIKNSCFALILLSNIPNKIRGTIYPYAQELTDTRLLLQASLALHQTNKKFFICIADTDADVIPITGFQHVQE